MLDLLITNGTIICPEKQECYRANLGIKGGKIALLTDQEQKARQTLDAAGHYLAPGFIDIHLHENAFSAGEEASLNSLICALKMGVTTAVDGNCGLNFMSTDLGDYFTSLGRLDLPINYLSYIGYNFLRDKLGIPLHKNLDYEDFNRLLPMLAKNLEQGACGVSFGLEYAPGITTEEMLWVGSYLANNHPDKLLAVHYRYDANRSLEAIAEMIIVARETKSSLQVSHIGSCSAFGNMEIALKMIKTAAKSEVDISADVYPYKAFCTFIGSEVFAPGCFERWNKGHESLLVVNGPYQGENCTMQLFQQLREEEPDTLVAASVMDSKEVELAVSHPDIFIASDGLATEEGGHPRVTGTFPRYLSKYVRDKELIGLPEAIKKITLLPAEKLGLTNKGRISVGFDADLTIFSLEKLEAKSTYQNPLKPPTGIKDVIVNGKPVIKSGEYQGGDGGGIIRI